MRGKIFLMLVGLIFFVGVSRGDGDANASDSNSYPPIMAAWPWGEEWLQMNIWKPDSLKNQLLLNDYYKISSKISNTQKPQKHR
jgi:hypothetical protein